MRIDLPDGQWAELRERISHGQAKAVMRASVGKDDNQDLLTELTRAYVKAWDIRDPDGNPIPTDAPDAVERMPQDTVLAIYGRVLPMWRSLNDLTPTQPSSGA